MIFLPDRLPWYLAGPMIGLLVVALYALANRRLGVTQSYVQLANALMGKRHIESWRLWLFGGMAAGALLASLLRPRTIEARAALAAPVPCSPVPCSRRPTPA